MVPGMPGPPRTAVKIPTKAYDELRRLAEIAAQHGWSAFGISRTDPPNLTARIEEAIRLLSERAKPRSKR